MLVLALLCCSVAYCTAETPLVQTNFGPVSGRRFLVNDTLVDAFYGIPYAEPPVGDLRFQRPRPVRPWKEVLNATQKPSPCRQLDLRFLKSVTLRYDNASEDCLYINIWRPARAECAEGRCQAKLPAIVYVHGGAFQWGDSALYFYDMERFVSKLDVVFVTFNYRVGLFGFLTTNTTDAPEDNGLWDQNLALKWVKENIGHFGGDPDDVTLAGESAGGIAVGLHAASPHSRGLFKRAFIQSGTPLSSILWRQHSPISTTRNIAGVLGCYNSTQSLNEQAHEVLACLKKLDAKVIMDALKEQGSAQRIFMPLFGGSFTPRDPHSSTAWTGINVDSVLLGTTSDEGSLFVDNIRFLNPFIDQILDQDYRLLATTFMATSFGIPIKDARNIAMKYYGGYDVEHDRNSVFDIFARIIADASFDCPTHFFATAAVKNGVPTYRYLFDHRPSYSLWPKNYGATHADDIAFFYGTVWLLSDASKYTDIMDSAAKKLVSKAKPTKVEEAFAIELMKTLYKFAKTGKPELSDRNTSWPAYSTSAYPSMVLRPNNFTVEFNTEERCALWKPYLYRD